MKKKILFGSLLFALGIGIGACANPLNEWVEAYKWADVTIKYNNTVQEMYDVNGNRVYPLNYNGTTYVPVRAVSNIFGVAVDWDDSTKTVLLGENSDWEHIGLSNVSQFDRSKWFQDTLNFTYDNIKYNTGIKQEDSGDTLFGNNPYDFNLNIKYKQLSCKIVTESEVTVPIKIVIEDEDTNECIYEKLTETNTAEDILIDVTGRDHISIFVTYTSVFDEKPGQNTTYIVDMKAK